MREKKYICVCERVGEKVYMCSGERERGTDRERKCVCL
jgi:hypothetical protein